MNIWQTITNIALLVVLLNLAIVFIGVLLNLRLAGKKLYEILLSRWSVTLLFISLSLALAPVAISLLTENVILSPIVLAVYLKSFLFSAFVGLVVFLAVYTLDLNHSFTASVKKVVTHVRFTLNARDVPRKDTVEPASLEEPVLEVLNDDVDSFRLPGIGSKRRHRIIKYREEHGPFSSVDELTQVSGIGPATVSKLKRVCYLTAHKGINGALQADVSNGKNNDDLDVGKRVKIQQPEN